MSPRHGWFRIEAQPRRPTDAAAGSEAETRTRRACVRACGQPPGCSAMIHPGRGTSPRPDEHRQGGADDPAQECVGQRPQPVKDVEAVKGELRGCVFAGECVAPLPTAPLPTALRYGKRLETRPIFTRTVCHSRTSNRPHLAMTRVVGVLLRTGKGSAAPVLVGSGRTAARRTSSALPQGRGHVGLHPECTVAAARRLRYVITLFPVCGPTSSLDFLSPK